MSPRRRALAILAVAAVLVYAGLHSAGHPGHSEGVSGKLGICLVLVAFVAAVVRLLPRDSEVPRGHRRFVPAGDVGAELKRPYLGLGPTPARLQRFRN